MDFQTFHSFFSWVFFSTRNKKCKIRDASLLNALLFNEGKTILNLTRAAALKVFKSVLLFIVL
jgi:hypothetical protein